MGVRAVLMVCQINVADDAPENAPQDRRSRTAIPPPRPSRVSIPVAAAGRVDHVLQTGVGAERLERHANRHEAPSGPSQIRGATFIRRQKRDCGPVIQFKVASNSITLCPSSVVGATMILAFAMPGPENSIDLSSRSSAPWVTG